MTAQDWVLIITTIAGVLGPAGAWLWTAIDKKQEANVAPLRKEISECTEDRKQLNARVLGLEMEANKVGVANWVRDQLGRFLYVSPMFVKYFGSPHGLGRADFIGRKPEELANLPDAFIAVLRDMDDELRHHETSTRHDVEIKKDVVITLIKVCAASPSTGDLVYTGYAAVQWGGMGSCRLAKTHNPQQTESPNPAPQA